MVNCHPLKRVASFEPLPAPWNFSHFPRSGSRFIARYGTVVNPSTGRFTSTKREGQFLGCPPLVKPARQTSAYSRAPLVFLTRLRAGVFRCG
ncbi:MAG: hypothetical protein ACFFD4_09185 [Candidatus Odinarchaeota archaeon]